MLKPKPKFTLQPNFNLLTELTKLGYKKIVGLDEVGRGAIAGPLVVSAVELSSQIPGITDSKLLTRSQREELAKQIHQQAYQITFGVVSVEEINQLGISGALKLAYKRALENIESDLLLTDFVQLPGYKYISQPAGDRYFYPTAAASVVAKVYRDQLMRVYHQAYPEYGWENNVGYGTKSHYQAIKDKGISRLHRLGYLRLR